jgi:glycolate oxidase iron-sulfur subunit
MRAVADEVLPVASQAFGDEMDFCLGCLACQTACPAKVDYAQLFEVARAHHTETLSRPVFTRLYRALTLGFLFRHPWALRLFGRLTAWTQDRGLLNAFLESPLPQLLPPRWQRLVSMTPRMDSTLSDARIALHERPSSGSARYRVGLLTGCIQDLAYASLNRDTADVLLQHGCEVLTPRRQHCCGSIHGHNGEVTWAQEMARKNLDAFPLDGLDAIITNAGGCGSHLRHYGRLLANDPRYADRAKQWDHKVRDIHEWLLAIGLVPPTASPRPEPLRVTYHESCHLCHGQGISSQPRKILNSLPGISLIELTDAQVCCGSAGVYSITQPETSDTLLADKVGHLLETGADMVATANPGCDLQLQRGLKEAGSGMQVTAPITLLAEAYRNSKAPA